MVVPELQPAETIFRAIRRHGSLLPSVTWHVEVVTKVAEGFGLGEAGCGGGAA